MIDRETQLLLCDCGDPEHQWILSWDPVVDDHYWDEFYIQPHLAKVSFWRRVKYAIRYICGRQSKTGAFSEMCLTNPQVTQLRDACNAFLAKSEEFKEYISK